MLVDLIEARPLDNHRVYLRFEDGLEGALDLGAYLSFRGIFAPLRDPECFRKLRVDPTLGTICWPNGADVAPETLYSWLKKTLEEYEKTQPASA
ncbi:hypothetical protein MIT9_P0900 [Methylomarinovum caldicuralii]|uniref:Molybdopterin-guanine dinucleotide biosynthesis protein A n=1 Tax=Methylomarinovum caldicuralii TaxID=438856 RepID=A0AAU9CTS8_9GAMM|nr:DUF2442 domain-containing protein [Methylomarinovum caldicuralii]BCX81322.1 hypothetical protein MIT9_P0900 [Methylomarinovum caldicuralii]